VGHEVDPYLEIPMPRSMKMKDRRRRPEGRAREWESIKIQ
jgi:hypothetical protein